MNMRLLLALTTVACLSACSGGDHFTVNATSNSSAHDGTSSGASISASLGQGQEKIINGVSIDASASPQIVRIDLSYSDGSTGICSGTAITSEIVLTAAHCFPPEITGASIANGLFSIKAESVAVHPGYAASVELNAIFNDIALVKFPGANLPSLPVLVSVPVKESDTIVTYGYGLNSDGEAGGLQNGAVAIGLVTPNHIFSTPFSGENADPCYGDSGGPAILGYTDVNGNFQVGIVGLVSSGTLQGCAEGDVTLFTNLQNADMASFILANAPGALIL